MKKILITGANGFLGINLTRMLSKEGYEISVFVRAEADVQPLIRLNVSILHGNLNDRDSVFSAVKGCHYVIHCAGITGQSDISFEEYERVNVEATKLLSDACLYHQIERFVYVSTANTIAPGTLSDPGTELNGFSYFRARSGYIDSKYLAQQFVLEQVQHKGLPAIVVNPTFMIGAYDVKPSSGQIILYGLNKKIVFYPSGGKNFVFVGDVCRGIIRVLALGKIGNRYLLAGENLSYGTFFRELNKISGRHPVMIKIPAGILKLVAVFASLWGAISHRPQKLTLAGAYMLCQHNYYSGAKSERELGLCYHTAGHAISIAYRWFVK